TATSTAVPPTRTSTPNQSCVASVAASVHSAQLGGGAQTLYVTALSASGKGVPGATGVAVVHYSTTRKDLALPVTGADGRAAVTWDPGGPKGKVTISVTESGGGCTATGSTNFQGRP